MRNIKLHLRSTSQIFLAGFTDLDWANCLNMRQSIGGYVWSLGSGVVSWASQKQKIVVVLSCKAEYMAVFEVVQECIWLQTVLQAISYSTGSATTIMCDNNAAINLSEDPMLHSHVKHINIKYHFLQEHMALKELIIHYINTKDNAADMFTKPLPLLHFSRLHKIIGLY